MAKTIKPDKESSPAMTPESRENQLIALAYDLAEKRLREGTASAQEITQLLRAGSAQARLDREMALEQKKLLTAKTETLESQKKTDEMYRNALNAMRRYNGQGDETDEEE